MGLYNDTATGLSDDAYEALKKQLGRKVLHRIQSRYSNLQVLASAVDGLNGESLAETLNAFDDLVARGWARFTSSLIRERGWTVAQILGAARVVGPATEPDSGGTWTVTFRYALFRKVLDLLQTLRALGYSEVEHRDTALAFIERTTDEWLKSYPLNATEMARLRNNGGHSFPASLTQYWESWHSAIVDLYAQTDLRGVELAPAICGAILARIPAAAWVDLLRESQIGDDLNAITSRLGQLAQDGVLVELYVKVLRSSAIPPQQAVDASKEWFDVDTFDDLVEAGLPRAEAYEISRTSIRSDLWIDARRVSESVEAAQIAEASTTALADYAAARRTGLPHVDCAAIVEGHLPLHRYVELRRLGLDHGSAVQSLIQVLATETQTTELVDAVSRSAESQRDSIENLTSRLSATISATAQRTAESIELSGRNIVRAIPYGRWYDAE